MTGSSTFTCMGKGIFFFIMEGTNIRRIWHLTVQIVQAKSTLHKYVVGGLQAPQDCAKLQAIIIILKHFVEGRGGKLRGGGGYWTIS